MRIITLDINKKIIGVAEVGDAYILNVNDIATDLGEMGQIQQTDGSFIDDITPIVPPVIQPTNQQVNDNVMACMSGIFDLYMK